MKVRPLNLNIFIVSTLIFLLLSIICFTASFTIDEGRGSILATTCARLFLFFKFPTVTFFPNYFSGRMLFFGLGFNSICYGLLIERIIGFILGCLISCVAKTHHKKDLIDFRTNKISANQLKLDGYYFMTYEKELTNLNSYERSVRQAGIKTAKSIDVYFINDDGFTHYMRSINGLTNYYCMQSDFKPENSYEKLHQIIEMFIANSKSEYKKVRK
jgi:hypothetical protein